MLKIVRISVVIETILFLIVGIFGYLSLGNSHMVDMFVLRESVGSLDYLIEGAIYAFILLNFYGVLIIFYSFREQVFAEFNMKRSLFDRAKVTIIGLGLCFLIGIFAPNMTQAFGVIGGMFCTLMGWIIPFLIKIRI